MKTVRASEIGTFLYCQRAWWYHRQGFDSENQAELTAGSQLHEQHAQAVWIIGCLRWIAYALLIAAIVTLAVYLTLKWLP
jgi:CRISPR/Cas system-associated exonuclease Cas4 (RecB family)